MLWLKRAVAALHGGRCRLPPICPSLPGECPPCPCPPLPAGDSFVKPELRRGVLPGILAALTAARACARCMASWLPRLPAAALLAPALSAPASSLVQPWDSVPRRPLPCSATREQLRSATDPATRAVLDCRQKALKITGWQGPEAGLARRLCRGRGAAAAGLDWPPWAICLAAHRWPCTLPPLHPSQCRVWIHRHRGVAAAEHCSGGYRGRLAGSKAPRRRHSSVAAGHNRR